MQPPTVLQIGVYASQSAALGICLEAQRGPVLVKIYRNAVSARCLLPPDSDHGADIAGCLKRAIGGLVHRSKEALFDDLVSGGKECGQIMHNLLRSRGASRSVFASDRQQR
jgi:hypothetical protein